MTLQRCRTSVAVGQLIAMAGLIIAEKVCRSEFLYQMYIHPTEDIIVYKLNFPLVAVMGPTVAVFEKLTDLLSVTDGGVLYWAIGALVQLMLAASVVCFLVCCCQRILSQERRQKPYQIVFLAGGIGEGDRSCNRCWRVSCFRL